MSNAQLHADSFSRLACAMLLVALAVAAPGRAATFLFLDSQLGDPIGQGERVFYSSADGAFLASGDYFAGRVTISFQCTGARCAGQFWYVSFTAPVGQPLLPGAYEEAEAQQPPPSVRPQLYIYGYAADIRSCDRLQGRFVVHEADYASPIGDVVGFAADFELTCEGAAGKLVGAIRFDAGDGACAAAPEGAPCDDRDPCSRGDRCVEGTCVGERSERCSPVTCDDDDPCTDDVLQENQCQSAPIAGTCWRGDEATLRIIATGSAYGRTAQCRLGCRAPFSGVLVLRDDGTYVSPGMTVPGCVGGATVTVPDEVGVVRRARRGKLVLEPTNRGELEAAFEQCAGPGTRLKGYRTVVHPSPDGQALTGTSTARIRTRQGRIPVAITLRIRFTTSRVEHPAASRAAVAARRPLPVCSPSLRPVCSVR